jgi:hypothetical protein
VVPESFQRTSLRSKLEMPRSLRLSRIPELLLRKLAGENAEKYYNEYTAADAALVKAKRDAKAKGSFYVEAEPKVAFVIRIRG